MKNIIKKIAPLLVQSSFFWPDFTLTPLCLLYFARTVLWIEGVEQVL